MKAAPLPASAAVRFDEARSRNLRMRRVLWGAIGLLLFIAAAVTVRRIVVLVPVLLNGYQPPTTGNPALARLAATDDIFARYPLLTLIHIIPGLLFLLLAPLQFNEKLRRRHLQWHRWNGRVLLGCGVVVGISALAMSFGMPSIGGVNQAAATILFALFFLFALLQGLCHVLRREIALHREWMIRAYAIGLAIATIRPIIGIFFATSRFSGLTPREFFGTGFWIGFTLHLVAAEAWIHITRVEFAQGANQ